MNKIGRPRRQHERATCHQGHAYRSGSFRLTRDGFKRCLQCERASRDAYLSRLRERAKVAPDTRQCSMCRETLPSSAFGRRNDSPTGISYVCRDCKTQRSRDRCFGLAPGEYDQLCVQQGGVCAICGEPDPSGRRLGVDHDHTTGRIRGLLCQPCNTALGLFKDDRECLQKALRYLGGQ